MGTERAQPFDPRHHFADRRNCLGSSCASSATVAGGNSARASARLSGNAALAEAGRAVWSASPVATRKRSAAGPPSYRRNTLSTPWIGHAIDRAAQRGWSRMSVDRRDHGDGLSSKRVAVTAGASANHHCRRAPHDRAAALAPTICGHRSSNRTLYTPPLAKFAFGASITRCRAAVARVG